MTDKLPKVLVVMLENILDDHMLSSWQFRGGPLYTQLTIRFTHGEVADDMNEVKYRRIPPSQILRDKIHVKAFSDKKEQYISKHSENNHNVPAKSSNPITQQLDDILNVDNGSFSVSNKTTANENVTERCLHKFNIAAAEADDFSRPTYYQAEGIADQGDQHLTMPGVKSDEEQERDGIKDSTVHTEDDLSSDDEVFSCDGCGCMMSGSPGTKWYRCTECVDLDICESCHKKRLPHRAQVTNKCIYMSPKHG